MDKQLDLLQGTLDMLILKAVSLGPLHGYGILLRIQSPANGASRKTNARPNITGSRRRGNADSKPKLKSGIA